MKPIVRNLIIGLMATSSLAAYAAPAGVATPNPTPTAKMKADKMDNGKMDKVGHGKTDKMGDGKSDKMAPAKVDKMAKDKMDPK